MNTKTNTRRKPESASKPPRADIAGLFLPRNRAARERVLDLEREALRVGIVDHFSVEQLVQIRRLRSEGDFEGTTEDQAIEETIAWLAESALFVFGLDPIARRAFDRVSEAVGTNEVDEGTINEIINDMHEAGEAWTCKQRKAERGAALKGRAA